jgi:hypothetical protein
MDTVDQAFWQLFHAVEAKMSSAEVVDALPAPASDGAVVMALDAPIHAIGVLRREAERRGVDYPALIAALSEERRTDLPDWWIVVARGGGVGNLMG